MAARRFEIGEIRVDRPSADRYICRLEERTHLEHFADLVIEAVRAKRTPLVVGLDPRLEQLPKSLFERINNSSDPLGASAQAFEDFSKGVIDAVADCAVAVKPQSAFFEILGPRGIQAFETACDFARRRGLLVIGDVKRGDIGTTCEAYADAYLGEVRAGGKLLRSGVCDAVTVNPYLGYDGIKPFIKNCRERGKGIFVLVKTSNPSSADFQDLKAGETPLFEHVARAVDRWGAQGVGRSGYSDIGAVVGATWPGLLARMRELMPKALFLLPGVGAQGATAEDVAGAFDSNGLGGLVAVSRNVIFAYEREPFKSEIPAQRWTEAVERAAREITDHLRKVLGL